MSKDGDSAVQFPKKRKMGQAEEDVGFPPVLKPIVTGSADFKPKLLLHSSEDSRENCREESEGESEISYVGDCDEGSEECRTPKSVEHQIPQVLPCPPAPRKPRETASKRPLDFFHVSPSELNLLFKVVRSGESDTEHFQGFFPKTYNHVLENSQ